MALLIRKQFLKVLVIALWALVGVGTVVLVVVLLSPPDYEQTRERADALYSAVAKISERGDENNCAQMLQGYDDERISAENYNTYADKCQVDLEKLQEQVNFTKKDKGVRKDASLAEKWAILEENYGDFVAQALAKIDNFKLGHEFLIEYNKLDLYGNSEEGLEKLEKIVGTLQNSNDGDIAKFAAEIVEKARALAESYKKLLASEKALVEKNGKITENLDDDTYKEYADALKSYREARQEYERLSEKIYKSANAGEFDEFAKKLQEATEELKTTASSHS